MTPDGVNYQKPRTNVYTMLLILSFLAITTALVLQYLMLQEYKPDFWKTPKIQSRSVERGPAVVLARLTDARTEARWM